MTPAPRARRRIGCSSRRTSSSDQIKETGIKPGFFVILSAMQKQTNRVIVAAVLIAAGIIGGFFVFTTYRRAAAIEAEAREVASRIDRMIATAGEIASAQQAYVAPGQPDQPWLERASMLLQQFGEDATAIRPLLRSSDAPAALDDVNKSFREIVVVDSKARQDLEESQSLLAADLIFSEGHDTIGMLTTTLRSLATSERQRAERMRSSAEHQQWAAVALVSAAWVLGLIAFAPVRVAAANPEPANPGLRNPEPSNAEPATHVPPAVDFAAAADVCAVLARATDTASLRAALARAADILDAPGIIMWMGAGEELFPVLSWGYDDRLVATLGPIPRNAANATAEAWRTAQLRTVAGDVMSNGAVAAPVTGVFGCVGVLAAELRHGREEDPATRAVAAILAAQLAGIVSAWPAASSQ